MSIRSSKRSVLVAIGGDTRRVVGRELAAPVEINALSGAAIAATTKPAFQFANPPGLYIPAYDGNPGVGLTNPGILTDYTGSSTIPQDDYQDKIFTGQKTSYEASTFTNCKFISGSNHSILSRGGTRDTFTDCEFGGNGTSRQLYASGGTYTLIRCDISQAEDGAKWANGMIMTMCHIHDLNPFDQDDPHADGVQAEGSMSGTNTIEYCHIDARRGDPLINGNAAVFVKSDLNNQDGGVIDNNYLNGGNYTLSLRTDGTPYSLTNMIVTNNIFGPDFRFGHRRVDSGTYLQWSDNVDTFDVPVTL
jgi:hypothetical protein